MKLVIAGSRDINISVDILDKILEKNLNGYDITEIVSGGAKGVDSTGIKWAELKKIPIKLFIPNWALGRGAGLIRNKEMGDYADIAIIIYNGSKGSQGMINYMKKIKKHCVVIYEKDIENYSS